MKRVLLAPLEWGLGHASRSIALARRLQAQGCEVVWAAEGDARSLIAADFPDCSFVDLTPSFRMRYSAGASQVGAVLVALPRLVWSVWREHRDLSRVVRQYGIDEVISDNRFGLWCPLCPCAYLTHQLHVRLPRLARWLEPVVAALHRRIISKYDRCLVPDYADATRSLAGQLSHPRRLPNPLEYIGPLSRFGQLSPGSGGGVLLLLSGPEPQRSLFETALLQRYRHSTQPVCLVRGTSHGPALPAELVQGVHVEDLLEGGRLAEKIAAADLIECRSGYSTVMDLAAAGKLSAARLTPTPGQPEQEYLAEHLQQHFHTVGPEV